MRSAKVALITAITFYTVHAKVYDHCELARELRDVHEIPENQLATWICIVKHESNFNTTALNPGSGDHGLFQISQLYWCSPEGHACGIPCSALEDDDIEDDVICARRIYRQHQRISGDGFNAWAVYPHYCKGDVGRYIKGCFDESGSRISGKPLVEDSIFGETPVEANTPVHDKSPPKLLTSAPAPPEEGQRKVLVKSDKVIVYKSAKANYAFNWKANGFRLIKTDDA